MRPASTSPVLMPMCSRRPKPRVRSSSALSSRVACCNSMAQRTARSGSSSWARGAEEDHDVVAEELIDMALVAFDLDGQAAESHVHDVLDFFGIEFLGQGGEARNVAEEDRDDLALVDGGHQGGNPASFVMGGG